MPALETLMTQLTLLSLLSISLFLRQLNALFCKGVLNDSDIQITICLTYYFSVVMNTIIYTERVHQCVLCSEVPVSILISRIIFCDGYFLVRDGTPDVLELRTAPYDVLKMETVCLFGTSEVLSGSER